MKASDGSDSASNPSLSESDQALASFPIMYKYRDFSSVENEDKLEHEANISEELSPPPPSYNSIRIQKFPVKLYAILAHKEFHDIIAWMPHGRAWRILKPGLFESLVMPLFFEYSNFHSFNRLVNAWSFRRISSGPDRGSYYHEVSLYPVDTTGQTIEPENTIVLNSIGYSVVSSRETQFANVHAPAT